MEGREMEWLLAYHCKRYQVLTKFINNKMLIDTQTNKHDNIIIFLTPLLLVKHWSSTKQNGNVEISLPKRHMYTSAHKAYFLPICIVPI